MTRHHLRSSACVLVIAAVLIAGCGPTGIAPIDGRLAQCAGQQRADLCQQALEAVIAELGERSHGAQIRIDPVQCPHGRCWTWAYVTPAGGGRDQQLSVDWLPSGEIGVGYVVQD